MSDHEQFRRPLRRPLNLNGTGVGTAAFSLPMSKTAHETDLSWRARQDPLRTRRAVQAALDSVERAARLSAMSGSFLGTDPVSRLLRQREDPFLRPVFPQNPAFVAGHEDAGRGPAVRRKRQLPPAPNAGRGVRSLRSYEPSLRDRAAWGVYDVFERFGAPNLGRFYAGRARQLVDFVPVLGDAVGVEEAGRDLYQGRYVEGTIGGVATALGAVPAAGDAAAQMVRAGRRRVTTIVDRLTARRQSILEVPEKQAMSSSERVPAGLYDLPAVEEPDIAGEYGRPPETDEQGNLLKDIDGNPIYAKPERIAGRRHVEGSSQAIAEDQYHGMAGDLTQDGVSYEGREHWGLGRSLGAAHPDVWLKKAKRIFIDRALRDADKMQVLAHEIAHSVEFLGGPFNTRGLQRELELLYHASNQGRLYDWKEELFTPANRRVKPAQYDAEYVAEALRLYMRSPAAMKKHFPKTAARLRTYVNKKPWLNRYLHLNSLSALGGTGLAALVTRGAQQNREEERNGL